MNDASKASPRLKKCRGGGPLLLLGGSNVVCVGALLFIIAVQPALRNFLLFYSDNITLPLYFKSVFVHHEAITGFMYGTQGFFFPEYPLYLVSYVISFLIPGNHYAASLIAMALLQVVCFNLALYYLGLALFRNKKPAAIFSSAGALILTLLLVLGQRLPLESWFPTDLFLTSTHHFAIALSIPLFFAGIINYAHSRKTGNLIFAVAISALVFPSDSAWSTWFLIPFFIALFLLFLMNFIEKRFFWLVAISTIFSAAAGKFLDTAARYFFRTVKPPLTNTSHIPSGLHNLKMIVISYVHSETLLIACLIIGVLCFCGLFFLGKLVYQATRAKAETEDIQSRYFPVAIVLMYSFVAGIIIVLATVLSGNANIVRYYALFVVFALFALIPLLHIKYQHQQRMAFIILALLCGAIVVSPLYNVFSLPVSNPAKLRPDDLVLQIAEKNLPGDFIGNYWTVLSTGLYTNAKAVPISATLSPEPTLQNTNDLNEAVFQNMICIGTDSTTEKILSRLPASYSKIVFQACMTTDEKVPVVIYHWPRPINQYLGRN